MDVISQVTAALGRNDNFVPLSQQSQEAAYSAELEKAARERGFKSAEEFVLFERQRQRPREQQTISGSGAKKTQDSKKKQEAPPPQQGGLIGVWNAINSALSGANSK